MKVSLPQLLRIRQASHRLAAGAERSPAALVEAFGAVQAQDYAASLWAVGVRLRSCVRGDVEAAIARAQIVRTWPMRGTLHFVAAPDVRWMLRLMAGRKQTSSRTRRQQLGLTESDVGRAGDVARRELAGRALTRPALFAAFEAAGLATQGQRGIHLVGALAVQGVLCVGPREGRQPTYVLLDEWVPPSPRDDWAADRALAEIARRYLGSHGPATEYDLAMWTHLPVSAARRGIDAAAHDLVAVECDGVTYWYGAGTEPAAASVTLLPAFDEYLLGYRDRSAVLGEAAVEHVAPGRNGIFLPTVMSRGRVVATWRKAGDGAEVRPFPGARQVNVSSALRRYQRFVADGVAQ